MLIVEVDGHTKGQACLFLPDNNLFIAADVCWGTEFLPFTDKMKWLPRKIQNNFEDYKKGNDLLKNHLIIRRPKNRGLLYIKGK